MFRIKVNATSANLCIGFDVVGLALELPNVFKFEINDKFEFLGFEKKYCFCNTNLVYKAYKYFFDKLNKQIIPVKIIFEGNIPICRGLGSSSSLIVAGVFAANYVLNNPLNTEELLNICVEIEGHPDNVAPAILGGFVASYKNDNGYKSITYPISDKLKFITIIPKYELSTQIAREVLPDNLDYESAINNLSRIIHLPKALELGDIKFIKELFNDKLHEPYRRLLIKEYDLVKKICDKENVAVCISGSGSTILVITNDDKLINKFSNLDCDIKLLKIGKKVEIEENIYE